MTSAEPQLVTTVRNHWWWRPGWRTGRHFYACHLTLDDQPQLMELVGRYQDALRQPAEPGPDSAAMAAHHHAGNRVRRRDQPGRPRRGHRGGTRTVARLRTTGRHLPPGDDPAGGSALEGEPAAAAVPAAASPVRRHRLSARTGQVHRAAARPGAVHSARQRRLRQRRRASRADRPGDQPPGPRAGHRDVPRGLAARIPPGPPHVRVDPRHAPADRSVRS